jgi:uncharacterized membrane protein
MFLSLASWIPFALMAAGGMFLYQLCAKLAGEQIPATIFATAMYTCGFIGVMIIFAFWFKNNDMETVKSLPMWPLIFSGLAGLSVIIVDLCIATMFGKGAPLGISMAVIFVLSLLAASVIGIAFFGERPSIVNLAGLSMALASIPLMLYNPE